MDQRLLDFLKTRRSVRSYQAKQVPKDVLRQVLEAGTYAPTARGLQAPVIVAVQNPDIIQELVRLNAQILGASHNPYYDAPTILLVFAPADRPTRVEDGTCVLMTLMLAAHAAGLGSCWINREREMFETSEGKALLAKMGLDESLVGIGALSLGYPQGELPEPKPRKADYIRYVE